jgi:hypothetical protein
MGLFRKDVTWRVQMITKRFSDNFYITHFPNDLQLCASIWVERGTVNKKKPCCTHFFSFAKFKFPENGIKMMDGARAKIPDVKCHKSSSTIDFIVLISISHINYWVLSSSYHRFWNCDHVAGWAIAAYFIFLVQFLLFLKSYWFV